MHLALLYESKPEELPEGAPPDLYMELEYIEDIELIADTLERLGHTVFRVNALGDPLSRLQTVRDRVDLVFNYSVGFGTRSREVMGPALCGLLGLPFTGSDAMALALASDKHTTKLNAMNAGIATPEWHRIERLADLDRIGPIGFESVVKPVYEGSSIGVRGPIPADDPDILRRVVSDVLQTYMQPVLVERFIAGYEITVPVIGAAPMPLHPVVLEVGDTLKMECIFDASIKGDCDNYRWTADLPITAEVRSRLCGWACEIHSRLGCRDFSRSDFRVTPSGEAYLLEINPTSTLMDSFMVAADAEGYDLAWILERIVENARLRWGL